MSHEEHTAARICSHVMLPLPQPLWITGAMFLMGKADSVVGQPAICCLRNNRCVCWIAANTVLLRVRAACVRAFAFSCWTLRDLAPRLVAAAWWQLCEFSRVQEGGLIILDAHAREEDANKCHACERRYGRQQFGSRAVVPLQTPRQR